MKRLAVEEGKGGSIKLVERKGLLGGEQRSATCVPCRPRAAQRQKGTEYLGGDGPRWAPTHRERWERGRKQHISTDYIKIMVKNFRRVLKKPEQNNSKSVLNMLCRQ